MQLTQAKLALLKSSQYGGLGGNPEQQYGQSSKKCTETFKATWGTPSLAG